MVDTVNLLVYGDIMTRHRTALAIAVAALSLLTMSILAFGHNTGRPDPGLRDRAPASSGIPFTRLLAPEHAVGDVVELLPAGSYQYARLIEPTGASLWVASLRSELELGPADVTVFGWREDFVSRRLDRTFDRLAFGLVQNAPGPRRP